jgi:hypothetical protein
MKATSRPLDVSKSLKVVFGVSLALFLAGLVLTLVFVRLGRHVQATDGKITGGYEKEVVKGRKQAVVKEFFRISYSVNGKEYFGEVPAEGHARAGRVPVHYHPGMPSFAWFYDESSHSLVIFVIFTLVMGCILFFSWRDLRRMRNAGQQT